MKQHTNGRLDRIQSNPIYRVEMKYFNWKLVDPAVFQGSETILYFAYDTTQWEALIALNTTDDIQDQETKCPMFLCMKGTLVF